MHRGAVQRRWRRGQRRRVLLPARRRLQHVLLQLRRVPRVVVGRHVVTLVPDVGGHDAGSRIRPTSVPHQSVDHGVARVLEVELRSCCRWRMLLHLVLRHGELGHGDVVLPEEVVGRGRHLTRHRVPALGAPPEHVLLQKDGI